MEFTEEEVVTIDAAVTEAIVSYRKALVALPKMRPMLERELVRLQAVSKKITLQTTPQTLSNLRKLK
jgi:hypothetical protein